MHILVVTDQHPDSLGGVQVALRLQRHYLEKAGHTVTIAAPRLLRPGYRTAPTDRRSYIALPALPITADREYSLLWPSRRSSKRLRNALARRLAAGAPPVDLVHVQGDFWGAILGIRTARDLGVPHIFTMHNNVANGTRAVTRLAPLMFQALRLGRRIFLGPLSAKNRHKLRQTRPRGAWRYLAELACEAALVTAPSQHFAHELQQRGVAQQVRVTPGGVPDASVLEVREIARTPRSRPRLVWLGRMSGEKRVLELVRAMAAANIDAELVLHGAGLLRKRVKRLIHSLHAQEQVQIAGTLSHTAALAAIHDADALVQSSVGFETQGLTPFEAAAVGTPTIFCDAQIAADLGVHPQWVASDTSVQALVAVLQRAVTDLQAALRQQNPLRVADAAGDRLLQSRQTAVMLANYTAVLQAAARG